MSESRTPEEVDEYEDLLDEAEHRWRNRLIGLAVLVALVVAGGYALWAMVLGGEGESTEEIQTAEVERGSISVTVSTSGGVVAQSTTNLSFDQSGIASAVNVTLGQEVKQGDVLAELESDDLQNAVTTAEVNLASAQTRLNQLLKGANAADLASADQSLVQAQATLNQANRTLEDLLQGPTASEILSAEQSVSSAQANFDQANRALEDVLEGPTESERLSAEQAVTSAESQLAQAEASRAQLYSASDDAVAAAEEAVRRAEDALEAAERTADSAESSLTSAEASLKSAETGYCALDATPSFCTQRAAPISSEDEAALLDATSDATLAPQAASVLAANTSYLKALDSKESASAAVVSAQADLQAAQRDLEDARSGPSSEDIAKADAAVASAQEALDAAEAKLAELHEVPTQRELEAAQDNVETARAALDAAQAKLAELNKEPTQSDLEAAQDNVDTAAAALAAAQAKRNDVYDGADWEDIELQQAQVQLAQLSVERAHKDLEKAQIIAPFDGTVAAINVEVGEVAGGAGAGGEPAIILNTPDAVRLDLVVTEADMPSIKVGQSGVAFFDAIADRPFPIVIDSVGTNPTTTQGIVTYEVRASILTGPLTGMAGALPTGAAGGRAPAQAGTPAAGATPSAGDGELPGGTRELPGDADTDAKLLPGMNASVTIVVEQAQDVITVPSQAIQVEGRDAIVEVQKEDGTTERLVVGTGLSDGTNTEIISGLEEGQTIIIPRGTAAAVQPTPGAGFPQFPEGGFPREREPGGGAP